MDQLAKFNQEDWAEQPWTLLLDGGPIGGAVFDINHRVLPLEWHVPIAPPVTEWASPDAPTVRAIYKFTGHTTDKGEHVYTFSGYK